MIGFLPNYYRVSRWIEFIVKWRGRGGQVAMVRSDRSRWTAGHGEVRQVEVDRWSW